VKQRESKSFIPLLSNGVKSIQNNCQKRSAEKTTEETLAQMVDITMDLKEI
jgi:hypothetical protein